MNKSEKRYLYDLIKEIKPRKPVNPMDTRALSECVEDDFESLQLIIKSLTEFLNEDDPNDGLIELKELNKRSMEREIKKWQDGTN